MVVSILDIIPEEILGQFQKDWKGNYKGPCPSCGNGGDSYGGFVIFPDSNTGFCAGSKTIFDVAEMVALVEGLITCGEGRQKK